ncbi:uncharacterized protein LOC105161520 isoform X2 [Sesamum indicum]|uniref:Uncharacterized protein LOC105161520 isoform X2 n=1 Tax=Sesamum indicum TaxID=4182 RepID=A0A6I9T5W9_SESIN|nr:uncharacterized protein LOC105161520 isoform X2 [Sesamum indicum]
MNLLKLNLYSHVRPRPRPHHYHRRHHLKLRQSSLFLFFPFHEQSLRLSASCATPLYSFAKYARTSKVNNAATSFSIDNNEEEETEDFEEYLAEDGEVYQKTLRLVECAMFAAVSGLAFLLSNSLAIEVATAVLLFVLSGPVKAITYLLLHGLLGFAMGTIWRLKASWAASVFLCAIVRATGALGNVVIASYLIGENILALITINVHALVTYILSSMGIIAVPSMNFIYFIFGFLLLLNCGFFVFLLHLLYAIFFTRLGMKASLRLPKWLEAAI